MTEPLRVGIVGAGGIAQGVHIPNYLKCGSRVEIVALADIQLDRAKEVAATHHIPYVFASVEEMLDKVSLDAVSVCTPNKFHVSVTLAALEAGCHVLCEKPPALCWQEAELMADAAQRAGKILTYGLHYRHFPEVETLKKFIDAGDLGEIYASRAIAVRRRGIPGWGVFTNKELQGGGPLIDIGVHMLDTALYLMGYPLPDTVFAATYQKIGNRQGVGMMGDWDWKQFSVEDMARGMIRFQNGSTLILETAFAANVEKRETMQVSLMGDKAGADVFPLKIYEERHDTLLDTTPAFLPKKGGHELEIERFVDACLGGAKPITTPEQGVALQKLLDALYRSAELGKPVEC